MQRLRIKRITMLIGSILFTFTCIFGAFIIFQPEWLFSTLRKRTPEVLYSFNINEQIVALTIDDGPDISTSPRLLEILKLNRAQATFFLITDRIQGNEKLIHRMISEGHELGNHLTNDEPSIILSLSEFESKLIEADKVLSQFGDIRWIRPGSGWYNEGMLSIIENQGYQCALGSIYPYDSHIGSAWFISQYVLWKIKPGAVIILHDYAARGERTIQVLETILPELNNRGYMVVTLSDLEQIALQSD